MHYGKDMYLQINYRMFFGNWYNGQCLLVQIQRCVILNVSSLDEIRYDNKLKKEEHKDNIDDNDDKHEAEPPTGLL